MQRLARIYNDPAEFEHVTVDPNTIARTLRAIYPTYELPDEIRWASIHEIFKAHKQSFRIITSYHDTFLTEAATFTSEMSKHVFSMFQSVADRISKTIHKKFGIRIRLNNVVNDSLQAAINMPKHVAYPAVLTCDIKSCYDVIPIQAGHPHNIADRLKLIVSLIRCNLKHGQSYQLYVKKLASQSAENHSRFAVRCSKKRITGFRKVTLEQWVDLVAVIIQNAYIQFGGVVKRKKIGMPQGLQFSKFIVDMYFMSYEVCYALRQCWTECGRHKLSELFGNFMRFADDLINVGGRNVNDIMDEMYPPCAQRELTWVDLQSPDAPTDPSKPIGSGVFLNIGLHLFSDGTLRKFVVFKEDKLPFQPQQYLLAAANRSHTMARNVILGQLLVAGLLNDTFSSCVFHLRKLLDIFLANGFDKEKSPVW
jgi:hypothetical protein